MYTFKNVWKKPKIREKMKNLESSSSRIFQFFLEFFLHFFKGMNKEKYHF